MQPQTWHHTEHRMCNGCATRVGNSFLECRQLIYHEGCFRCNSCDKSLLEASAIFLRNDNFFCGQCYLGTCGKCGHALAEQTYLQVDEQRKYHLDCFRCERCARPIDKFIIAPDNKCYCIADYLQIFWQCSACKQSIAPPPPTQPNLPVENGPGNTEEQDYVQMQYICFESNKFHMQCFVCAFCQKPMEEVDKMSRNVFVLNGKLCCRTCVVDAMLTRKSSQATDSKQTGQ